MEVVSFIFLLKDPSSFTAPRAGMAVVSEIAVYVIGVRLIRVGLLPAIRVRLREDHDALSVVGLVEDQFLSRIAAQVYGERLRGDV